MEKSLHFFPLWKRGMKGDLTAFQKAKRLQKTLLLVFKSRVDLNLLEGRDQENKVDLGRPGLRHCGL
jgi:hypothetical protein